MLYHNFFFPNVDDSLCSKYISRWTQNSSYVIQATRTGMIICIVLHTNIREWLPLLLPHSFCSKLEKKNIHKKSY